MKSYLKKLRDWVLSGASMLFVLAVVLYVAMAIVDRLTPIGRPEGSPPSDGTGPAIELIEPGVVEAKLRVQEGHILELRVRVEALEKAIGKDVSR